MIFMMGQKKRKHRLRGAIWEVWMDEERPNIFKLTGRGKKVQEKEVNTGLIVSCENRV